jgi:hypothetical protein
VNSAAVLDDSLTTSDIGVGAVASSEIADGTVALADMASNSVDSTKVVDNSIKVADLNKTAGTVSIDPGALNAAGSSSCQLVSTTLAGVVVGDTVLLNPASTNTEGRVLITPVAQDTAGTLKTRACNVTASNLTAANTVAQSYNYTLLH